MTTEEIIIYISAYCLFIGFFLIERFVRKGENTKNMGRTKFDRGSTTVVSIVMGTAFVTIPFAPLMNYFNICGIFNLWLSVAGIIVGAMGLVIRYMAFKTLGRFFTRILREEENHKLIKTGIYKRIRHPGYLSDILIFIGAATAMGNLILIIAIPVMFIPAYMYRISAEEKMLIDLFGTDYIEYKKTSKKLIPFIF